MRLLELGLLRFGGFSDARLDLSAPGLHLIHGRNEAGKSTALRGITSLLYGVPHRTGDAYQHDELLLSGKVRARDGSELAFQRRKGRKNTLLSPAGEPLEERVLAPLLGGVSESVFVTTFGLDHVRLREGGELLATGGGDVGQSLFDAGIGGGSVKRVLEALGKEAERLYNPRAHARTPEINAALREYKEKVELVRTESTRPQAWADQKKELEAARAELAELDRRRAEDKRLLGAAQELVKVLPLVAKRDAAERELVPVARAPLLPEDATERRIVAERDLEATERESRRVEEELEEVERAIAELVIPEELLSLDDQTVDALHERLGQYRRDRTDLGKRRGELAASEAQVGRRLAALGRALDTDARALVPRRADVARVKALTVERARLDTELAQAKKREAEARAAEAALEAELALDPEPLREAGAPPGLLERELPGLETVDGFARRYERLARTRDKLDERRRDLEREVASARTELSELELAGEVPTEAELGRVREARDASFAAIKAALAAEEPAAPELAGGFERLGRQADELADRLRREASRVARFAALEARRLAASEGLAALAGEQHGLEAEQAALDAEWRALWTESGVVARAPAELRGLVERWLRARERRREQHAALGRARAALASEARGLEEQERAQSAWRSRWAEAVHHLGLDAEATPAEADAAQVALGELTAELDSCDALRHRIAGMEQACQSLERDAAELARRHLPELAESAARDVEQAATAIIQRQRACREAARKRSDLLARRARAQARLSELSARREAALGELALLTQAAGLEDRALLPEAEAQAATRRRAEREIAELDRELCEACGTASLDAVRERARGVSLPEARARVFELEELIAELDTQRDAARDRVRSAELGLERYDDRQSAADAQVEVEALLAKIRAMAERWARVKLAFSVLKSEVEHYRATHQAPLLARTNQLFPRLTLGSYAELRVDHDAEPPVLSAIAKDGARVPIASLSDGTRDQLYLALRLASLEHYASVSEALPLCLDDVLINFDDERSRAALEVLAEAAQHLQVLLFTHHEHVVRAAVAAVPASALTVHELRRGEAPRQRSQAELGG